MLSSPLPMLIAVPEIVNNPGLGLSLGSMDADPDVWLSSLDLLLMNEISFSLPCTL